MERGPCCAAGLLAGRYNWQVAVTADTAQTSYNGAFSYVTGSTAANDHTGTPFGPGWSPSDLYRLLPVTGGVILHNPDGTSLWFAQHQDGTFASPAGDFSTLSYDANTGLYTRTLTDGTRYNFNTAGQQVSIVERHGNTTTYTWDAANQLVSITDWNGQQVTLSYDASGQATAITDPASRVLGLSYNASNQLTSLTDPDGTIWNYDYTASNQLTSLGDPTKFTYWDYGMAASFTAPNSGTATLTPSFAAGLDTPATLQATAASFTTASGHTTRTYLDPFGRSLQTSNALGGTSLTYRDRNGLAWLTADAQGDPTRSFFNAQGNVSGFT